MKSWLDQMLNAMARWETGLMEWMVRCLILPSCLYALVMGYAVIRVAVSGDPVLLLALPLAITPGLLVWPMLLMARAEDAIWSRKRLQRIREAVAGPGN